MNRVMRFITLEIKLNRPVRLFIFYNGLGLGVDFTVHWDWSAVNLRSSWRRFTRRNSTKAPVYLLEMTGAL